ncbi:HER060Wp [Eremothecium sinecaudum]|uniref:Spindle assembly checkpoint component MAD1 n=1 Tax=Eremothecium sinecaudum TaxID=45286 RepID=A0A0X8HTU4_9SACH|nr:HER060Wp [Eremothecium sinecaudum]AMD21339.1 HER060Wp [Eremothecium sinecaudum]
MSHTGDSSSFIEEPVSPRVRVRDLERQVLALQYRLNTEQNDAEIQKLSLERELTGIGTKYKQCMEELEKALSDTRYLYDQNGKLEKRLADIESKNESQEELRKIEAKVLELTHALRLKDQAYEELSSEHQSMLARYERKVENLTVEVDGNKSLLSKYEEEIGRHSEKIRSLSQECAKKEDEISVLKASKVVMAHHNYNTEELQELTILNNTLKEQMALSKELERANLEQANELKRLRQKSESQEFLKLENSKLQLKLEQVPAMEQKLEDLQLENVLLQEKLTNWELYKTESSSPQDVIREYQLLKQERLALSDELSKIQIDFSNMKILNDELALERNQLLDLNKKYETSILNLKKLNYEIEQQKLLSFEECKLLRQQLDDLTEIDKNSRNANADRKEFLSLVDNYKNQTEDLTSELIKLNEELLRQSEADENTSRKKRRKSDDLALTYSQRLNELQLKNKDLERKLATSQESTRMLEEKLGKLQLLNEKKIRILQLRNNPYLNDQFVKQKQLNLLKEENSALLKKLDGENEADLVPRSVYERQQFDIKQMEQELFAINKRTTRLKEMFNRKSLEFIDAVNSLLGFKLEFQVGGKVKMIPCFTHDKYLIADLQTNTLKSNLDKVIPGWNNFLEEYVGKKGQLPCFLAKVILTLAENHDQ